MRRVNFSPVGVGFNVLLYGPSKPIDVDVRKPLFRKIYASVALGPLTSAMRPDECRVFSRLVGKRVIGGHAGIGSLEPTDLIGQVTGGDFIGFPFLNDFHLEVFGPGIITFPEFKGGLREFVRITDRREGVFCSQWGKETKEEENLNHGKCLKESSLTPIESLAR